MNHIDDAVTEQHAYHRRHVAGCEKCQLVSRGRLRKERGLYRDSRELRDGVWVSVYPTCEHGHYRGYVVYACRCNACKQAKAAYQKDLRNRRKEQP